MQDPKKSNSDGVPPKASWLDALFRFSGINNPTPQASKGPIEGAVEGAIKGAVEGAIKNASKKPSP